MSDNQEALKMLLNISGKIPFFHDLSRKEILSLVTDVKILTYFDKQVIFNEGETGRDYLFYLLRGKVAVTKKSDISNVKTRLAVIDEPCLFGEMMRLTGEPRSATIESVDNNTLVLAFKVKEFEEKTPVSKFYKNVIAELADKLKKMNMKMQ
jgi:CRP-like cAMP-binding protein